MLNGVTRCVPFRETAAPVGGDCYALSGLLEMFVLVTQGGAIARKTRGRLPWAVMLRPLRGKETWAASRGKSTRRCEVSTKSPSRRCPSGRRDARQCLAVGADDAQRYEL